MSIQVLYTCRMCGLTDKGVDVRERKPGEDVLVWFNGVIIALGQDHADRSPWCRPKELTQIKIPIPAGTQELGGPVVN